jgi:hypothetical protein
MNSSFVEGTALDRLRLPIGRELIDDWAAGPADSAEWRKFDEA